MDQQPSSPFGQAGPPAPQAPAPTAPADEARGGVAEGIFAEVERMTAGGAMNRSEAFEEISRRTGRRAGTVAANYYRIARKRGTVAPRKGRGPGRPRGASPAAATGDAAAAVARAEDAVRELAALVREQQAEIERLRTQAEQFDKLRKLIADNT